MSTKGNCEHCERILQVDWYQLAAGVPDWHRGWWTAVFPNPTASLCEGCAAKFEAVHVYMTTIELKDRTYREDEHGCWTIDMPEFGITAHPVHFKDVIAAIDRERVKEAEQPSGDEAFWRKVDREMERNS